MARVARAKSGTGIYHIMLRGINRQTIFEDDQDRIRFLDTLEEYKHISKYKVYGYCLMNNHIHLLIREADESISDIIKRICSGYVYWYNEKYDRSGHLFQERFKSEVVEDDGYFFTVLRYIHQNPLKAKAAKSVDESQWTSYQEYIGKANIVDIAAVLDYLSKDWNEAVPLFMEFMNEDNEDQCLDEKERIRLSDHEVREYIKQLDIANVSLLQQLEKKKRDAVLSRLKKLEGISIRQIARVTGISKSVIDRA